MTNLTSFIRHHATASPDHVALMAEDEETTYAGLLARALALAAYMARGGVGPDDVVAVLMRNSPAFIEICLATSHVGAIFLPINVRYQTFEVGYVLRHAAPKMIFVDDELAHAARQVGDDVAVVGEAERREALAANRTGSFSAVHERAGGDLFRLMYTSGTTDSPKGVMHSYDNFYWKCRDQAEALGLDRHTRLLIAGPLYHVGASDLPGLGVLLKGGTLCILRDSQPRTILEAFERYRPTGTWLAPVMLQRLLDFPATGQFDLSSLDWIIGGGSATPERMLGQIAALFPGTRYIDSYGLTETLGGDTLMPVGLESSRPGSVGRPLAHVEISIRDGEGREMPTGEPGEICIRGPKVTKGYFRDPDLTARSFFEDGWFRSGDLGHKDDDGFIYVTDRIKDMIVTGAENVASAEVERVIGLMEEVADVAVISIPSDEWGETVAAVIVGRSGASIDAAAIRAHCARHLASFKVPKAVVGMDALPRNASGKVLKGELRSMLADRTNMPLGQD